MACVRGNLLRRAGIILAAAVMLATGAATASLAAMPSAQAASTPTWKVDKVYPPSAGGSHLGSVSAVGLSDIWVAGDTCTTLTCSESSALVSRWNGKAWQAMPALAAPLAAVEAKDHVVATSPSNAWVLGGTGTGVTGALVAQHWTGKSWSKVISVGKGSIIWPNTAVAPSASSVWAFGYDLSVASRTFVAHYNGSSWSLQSFPHPVSEASAASASDIWVIGNDWPIPKSGIGAHINQWTGRAWRSVALPRITVPSGDSLYGLGIADLGPGNVWAEFGLGGSDPQTWTIKLAHLTAHGWSVLTVPAPLGITGNTMPGLLGGTARGGVWAQLLRKKAAPGQAYYPSVFVQPAGKSWRVIASPEPDADIFAVAGVPGSAAAVAVGDATPRSTASYGSILGYGI